MLTAAPSQAEESAPTLAVFDFNLIDHSDLEGAGPNEGQRRRLRLISELLRRKLMESGRYEVVGVFPDQGKIGGTGCPPLCANFERKVAAALGAELWAGGEIRKVSNLILSADVTIKDTATAETVWRHSSEFRGDTDKSWLRAVNFILRYYLLPETAE
ncbi:MAG: DUF3280 domain-containing protein [Alphaproteobacteria bacterium]|nr:DUF3280 domain-containing protein [Alphaproteobacteria bacterium]